MWIYGLNIILIVIYGFIFRPSRNNQSKKIFLFISFAQMTLITSLRSQSVGWDTYIYVNQFFVIGNSTWGSSGVSWFEPGYIFLNRFILLFSDNYNWLFFFCSLLIFIPIGTFIYKYSQNVLLSVFVYISLDFFYSSMNIVRQWIAIAICLIVYRYIIEKKNFKALVYVLFSTILFHNSAVVMLLFIFFLKFIKEMNVKNTLKILLSSIIVFIFFVPFLDFIINIFPVYNQYFDSYKRNMIREGNLSMSLVYGCIFLIALILRKSILNEGKVDIREYDTMLFAVLMSFAINLISIKLSLINRFSYVFSIFAIVLIPNMISTIKNKKLYASISVIIILIMLTFSGIALFYAENGAGRSGVLPYEFFWENK
ncbi:EpsG family protein [Acinetobacter sp. CUI P1]|nr:EpsG family protein [Acinetobacter sp. CUI P1]